MKIAGFFRKIQFLFCPKKDKKGFFRELKNILGFSPNNIRYYELAFLHKSASVKKKGKLLNNERLEFLGDAVLDMVIAEYLFKKYPYRDEGFLTQTRSKIVNGANLHKLARKLNLHKLVVANMQNGRGQKSIYGDTFEAFIGAIYLDKDYKTAKKFIIERVIRKHINIPRLVSIDTNYKSQLIEWGQKYKLPVMFYTDLESPDSKYFVSHIRVDNKSCGFGRGISKKEAEQKAAKDSLKMLKNEARKKDQKI